MAHPEEGTVASICSAHIFFFSVGDPEIIHAVGKNGVLWAEFADTDLAE